MTWVSLVFWIFSTFDSNLSRGDSRALGLTMLGALIVWLRTLLVFAFPRVGSILICIGGLVFSPIAIWYDEKNAGFAPFLILLLAGAAYGIREQAQDLETRNARTSSAKNRSPV